MTGDDPDSESSVFLDDSTVASTEVLRIEKPLEANLPAATTSDKSDEPSDKSGNETSRVAVQETAPNTMSPDRTPERQAVLNLEGHTDKSEIGKVLKVDDSRQQGLECECKNLETSLRTILRIARRKEVIEVDGKPLASNLDFAECMLQAGQEIVAAGYTLVERGQSLKKLTLDAMTKYDMKQCDDEDLAFRGNPSSESDTEEGREKQKAERAKIVKEKKEAQAKQLKSDAEVSGTSKIVQKQGKNVTVFVCNVCEAVLTEKRLLTDHLRAHTSQRLPCHLCSKKYSSKRSLDQHIKDHKSGPWICNVCSKSFKIRTSFLNHVKAHENKNKLKCDKCNKTFTYKAEYEDHCATGHTKGKTLKCDLCDEPVKSLKALRTHKSYKHNLRDEKGRRLP